MQDNEVNYYISRLFSPVHIYKVGGVTLFLKHPSNYHKYLAEIVWRDTYEESIELFNQASVVLYLIKDKLWDESKEDELNKQKEILEELKVKLFTNRYQSKTVELLTRKIKEVESHIANMLSNRHRYDHLTAEYVADQAKARFLVGCGLWKDGKKYWRNPLEDYKKSDSLIEQIINIQEIMSDKEIRAVARSPKFVTMMKYNKPHNDELLEVYQWAKMYEAIHKHPEPPEDFVFENDYMLDGWVIYQRRKTEHNKLERKANEIAAKHKHADNIFIMPHNDITVDKIMNMNSEESKRIIQERAKFLKEKGVAHEIELPDVRRELEMQLNRSK